MADDVLLKHEALVNELKQYLNPNGPFSIMFNFFQHQKQQGYARPLHPHHWQALTCVRKNQQKPQMELMEFLQYWEVSQQDLAKICNCSASLVNKWFIKTKNHLVQLEQLESNYLENLNAESSLLNKSEIGWGFL